MKNKEKYNLSHLHIVERRGKTRLDYCFVYVEIEYGGRIIKEYRCLDVEVSKKFFEWLEEDDGKECKPTILTDEEKAYLSAIIKPFRDKKIIIGKLRHLFGKEEYIWIDIDGYTFTLPHFEKGGMYKGMEQNKFYKSEELGL